MSDQIVALVEKFKKRKLTLALAESCTGGMLSAQFVAVPGVSEIYLGSVVAYDYKVKESVLGVPSHLIKTLGAVSAPVALEMARGVRNLTKSDWSVAITGIAGPGGGTPTKPVGTVWMAWVGPGFEQAIVKKFEGGRQDVQKASCDFVIKNLLEFSL